MSDRFFLDTNILIYSFDRRDRRKRGLARGLVRRAIEQGTGLISYQVVQECLSVGTRKAEPPMDAGEASLYLREVLAPLCQVQSSLPLYGQALDIQERWQLGFYDALIVAAALAAGCDTLYSEDLQDGLKVRDLTVRDPFRE